MSATFCGREAEVLEQRRRRRALAVAVDADHGGAAVLPPAVGDARLDRDARQLGRQHAGLVGHALAVEHAGAGHADHAHRDAALRQLGLRMQRQLHLAAGGDDHRLRLLLQPHLARLGQHVGALGDLVQAGLRRVGQVLPRQQQRARPRRRCSSATAQATAVSAVSAGRQTSRPGDQPQRRRVLDALVRGAVLAQADAVVREDVDHAPLHQRGHADGVAAVVAEGQEGAAVGDEAAVQRDAVHDRGHAELAHAVVDVAARRWACRRRRSAAPASTLVLVRFEPVRSADAAEQLGQRLGEGLQRDLAGLAAGHRLGLGVRGDHRVDRGLREVRPAGRRVMRRANSAASSGNAAL